MRFNSINGGWARASALAAVLALSAGAASATTLTFDLSSPSGPLGTSQTYTMSGLSIVATGYDQTGALTALFGKNAGGDENGLGLHNDATGDNEIRFDQGFVQLDLSGLVGKVVLGSTVFSTNSTTFGEQWTVYGTNTAGSIIGATSLSSGQDESSNGLPDVGTVKYKYYDFVETTNPEGQGDNFLIEDLTTTTAGVPEPATWAMMLVGFFGLGGMIRGTRGQRAITAA
jgi:hypothetical protein